MCTQCHTYKKGSLYNRLIARFYDPFMEEIEKKVLFPKRQNLLKDLQGNILEVGAGTGVNFPFYSKEASVLALEPSGAMLSYASQRMKRSNVQAEIYLLQAGIGYKGVENSFPRGGFDAIVCTLVLCSVPNLEQAIADLRSWLKPGGQLVVLEHIQVASGWRRYFYKAFNPVWNLFSAGCNLTRDTDRQLKAEGFLVEWEHYFQLGMPFYEAKFYLDEKP